MKHLLLPVLLLALICACPATSLVAQETDIALLPAQVLKPVPEKYADSNRIFQGIPSMTIAPNGRLWVTWYTSDQARKCQNRHFSR